MQYYHDKAAVNIGMLRKLREAAADTPDQTSTSKKCINNT